MIEELVNFLKDKKVKSAEEEAAQKKMLEAIRRRLEKIKRDPRAYADELLALCVVLLDEAGEDIFFSIAGTCVVQVASPKENLLGLIPVPIGAFMIASLAMMGLANVMAEQTKRKAAADAESTGIG